MTLQEYNDLYKMPLLKSMTITSSGGITITNANIVSENMSLEKSLCSDKNLRYGRCEAACFTIRIADLNHDFTGEWLDVIQDVVTDSEGYLLTQNGEYLLTEDGFKIKLKDEEIDEATAPYGLFKVYSDKPENDRRWRVLTCYDQMHDILNTDVLTWYNGLTFPMTIKNLRDSFFSYLGITQVTKTLVNDNFSTPGGFTVSGELSGKTVIESICELNGVFGQMTADGKFDYVSLTDAEELTFDYYVDGTGSYEDYVTDAITGINIKGTSNDVGITVGTTDNLYVISSNPLVYGTEGTSALTTALTALLNHISADSFRPFKVTTYGNPMLPLGTKVTLNTKNKTIVSYVINKNLKGIQGLKDEISATSDKHQPTAVNSPRSEIFRTQGKVHELEINVDGLTSRVSATETNLADNYSTTQEMNSAISQTAQDITTTVSNTYVTQSAYNAEVQNLQDQIDGRIEYFDGNVVPTLNNPPANSWTTTSIKDSHVGDLYRYHYTQGGVDKTDYYRFDKDTSTTPATYSWVALGESEVDEALRQAELANQKADAAQAQLDSLEQNVEDNYYTKTQTNSAINQSASAITQSVSSTYETKSDSTSKFNTANTNAQGYANDAKNAANAATDNKLQNYYTKTETNSQIQQTADSITQSVSATYTTKTDFNNLSIGGRNLFKQTTEDWKSRTLLGNDNESFTLNGSDISVTADNVCDAIAFGLKENDIIQISFDIKFSSNFVPISGQTQAQYVQGSCNFGGSWSALTMTGGNQSNEILNIIYSTSREGHINTYFKVPSKMVDGTTTGKFYLNIRFNYWSGTVYLKNVMVEKASKPSDWSPAPEDSKEYADSVGEAATAAANSATDAKLGNYYTITETNSQIQQTASSITQTVSETYTTKEAFNNLEIGGRNLFLGTGSAKSITINHNSGQTSGGANFYEAIDTTNNLFKVNDEITISFDWTANKSSGSLRVESSAGSPYTWGDVIKATGTDGSTSRTWTLSATNKQGHIEITYKVTSAVASSTTLKWFRIREDNISGVQVTISNLKLERGNRTTDWSPAPEDTDVKFGDYYTKSETNSQITQTATSITSMVEETYTTKTDFNNLQIGGTQMLWDTNAPSFAKVDGPSARYKEQSSQTDYTGDIEAITDPPINGIQYGYHITQTGTSYTHAPVFYSNQPDTIGMLKAGQEYTLSLYYKWVSGTNAKVLNVGVTTPSATTTVMLTNNVVQDNKWHHASGKFTANQDMESNGFRIYFGRFRPSSGTGSVIHEAYLCGWKLEEGNKATSWSEHPIHYSSKSEIEQLSNKIALKVNSQGRIVTAALGVDPASSTSYFSVKADDISFISNGNITLATGSTGKIGIDSTNFKVNKDTGNVSVTGAITATSLTLGSGVSVAASKVSGLASVATSGSANDVSGLAAVAKSGRASDVSGLATVATSGRASDVSGLAAVATSGSYSSLSGKPDLTVYVAKDGTIGTVADGSTGFVVSSAGLLQASNAIIYGTIYSAAGLIGSWKITSKGLYDVIADTEGGNGAGISKYGEGYAFWAGSDYAHRTTAPFRVGHNGNLTATQATITGTITSGNLTATGGTIGGWSINPSALVSVYTARYSGLATGLWVMGVGSTSGTSFSGAKFRVHSSGTVYCNDIFLTDESGNSLSNTGQIHIASYGSGGSSFFMYDSSGNTYFTVQSEASYANFKKSLSVGGNLLVAGSKSRLLSTPDYGSKLMYCYETPSPLFGDLGEGRIAEDGKCYVWLDSVFSETIKTESYQVFLQKYGQGECYVTERTPRYFVVEGNVGMSFGWEIKARQAGFENNRLETYYESQAETNPYNYGSEANEYLKNLAIEREVA